jgi:hypothetical protein
MHNCFLIALKAIFQHICTIKTHGILYIDKYFLLNLDGENTPEDANETTGGAHSDKKDLSNEPGTVH